MWEWFRVHDVAMTTNALDLIKQNKQRKNGVNDTNREQEVKKEIKREKEKEEETVRATPQTYKSEIQTEDTRQREQKLMDMQNQYRTELEDKESTKTQQINYMMNEIKDKYNNVRPLNSNNNSDCIIIQNELTSCFSSNNINNQLCQNILNTYKSNCTLNK